jgi:HAD superfamily hydrolase (TIGR01509 family)
MTPKLVIFDCDGVLVDSEGPVAEVVSARLARHGLPLTPDEVDRLFTGGTLDRTAARAREMGARLPDSWVPDTYAEIYARLRQGVPLIPGILELIAALDAARIPRWVASNGAFEKMRITLTPSGLWDLFDGRILSREILPAKPAPDMILHAIAAEGVAPGETVMIDDSATGCTAAQNAGVRCLGFAARGDGSALAAAGAEVVRSMAEVRALLLGAREDVLG